VFIRKGKVKPFAKLVKSKEAQRVLAKIMSDDSVSNDTMKAVQSFTNSIYGAKSKATVGMPLNKFRYKVFEKAYSQRIPWIN